MAEKFTPGPWITENYPVANAVMGGHGFSFCIAKCDGCAAEDYVKKANASLIAAAPELFRALQAAPHALKSYQYGNASTELAASVSAFADSALAKARGETQ
jgi:hypothetical protein